MSNNLAVIVLSAGKGSRMKTDLPKVLHQIAELPMALHVIHAAQSLNPQKIVAIVGHKAELVKERLLQDSAHIKFAEQTEQLGTGHAALMAEEELKNFTGDVLVLNGDVPLMNAAFLQQIYKTHIEQQNDLTLTTAVTETPKGLGRIIRNAEGQIIKNVEQKDCTEAEDKVTEVNVGIYLTSAAYLFSAIKEIGNDNASGEYYITDIIALAIAKGLKVGNFQAEDPKPYLGVNTPLQLAQNEAIYQQRKREELMLSGVRFKDPHSVFLAYDTQVGPGTYLGPNLNFGAGVTIGDNAYLEGQSFIADSAIAADAFIKSFCHIEGATIASKAIVGPFARLRAGTELGEKVKLGSFVETKKALLGKESSVAHLSYLGDTTVGQNTNIGGGTITCNYDGTYKHQTLIGDDVFIGSNNALVAPVSIENGASTAAGSTITDKVPQNALAFGRARQVNKIKKQIKEA